MLRERAKQTLKVAGKIGLFVFVVPLLVISIAVQIPFLPFSLIKSAAKRKREKRFAPPCGLQGGW